MSFMTEAVSRIGGRELNEDSYGYLEMNQNACWVVADGLGGHRGGEMASKVAVDAALASFRATPEFSTAALQRHLEAAQTAILQAQKNQPSLSTMRTTIVILLTDAQSVLWAHVGDSRLYCLENGHIDFCTKDHSVVQAMVSAGELPASQIRHHEDRNRLLRCLGNSEADFRPTILQEARALHRGTAFLLCTDGFWENVTEAEMEVDYAKADGTGGWLALMEDRLLERATENSDNYTAIAVRFEAETASSSSGAEPSGSFWRTSPSGKNARLARVGFFVILIIAMEIPVWRMWKRQHALEQQIESLSKERDKLVNEMNVQQQKLDELQKEVQGGQSKGEGGKQTGASAQGGASKK